MGIAKILKLVGLYKVNDEYLKPVNDKLEGIEEGLDAVANVSDSASQIVDALNSGDKAKAIKVALEFCKIDDEVKELKEIQKKVEGGETIDAAIAVADGPALTKEIVESTMREVADHYNKIAELLPNIVAVGKETAEKVANLPSAAANWSLAEKIGTPEAVRNTGKKANQVKDSAEEAKEKLEALKESIGKTKA